jgi:glycosyltransferase involved in cell wall biosynthesis
MKPGTRILFFTTEDWYFCSHRLPVARAAREAGAEVHVVTRVANHGEAIRGEGFTLHPMRAMRRRSSSPLREAATVAELTAIYHSVRPDLVHHVALKPVVYGSLAARLARVPAVVNALAGMGYLFTDDPEKQAAAWSRVAIRAVFRSVLRIPNALVLFQNPDDRAVLTDAGVVALDRTAIIRGSGVDMAEFESTPEPQGVPLIVFGGRMLRQTGVGELHEAARLLRDRGVGCRVALVGDPDQIVAKLNRYLEMGFRAFILSGYPHREEAELFARHVLPRLPTCRLNEVQGRRVPDPVTPLTTAPRR